MSGFWKIGIGAGVLAAGLAAAWLVLHEPKDERLSVFHPAESERHEDLVFTTYGMDNGSPENRMMVASINRALDDAFFRSDSGWLKLKAEIGGAPVLDKIRAVHRFFNERIAKRRDMDNYGQDNYFALPSESVARGGDCDDHAIARYAGLKDLGISADDLRVFIIDDLNEPGKCEKPKGHAVLVVWIDGVAHVMDSDAPEVFPAMAVSGRYVADCAFNENYAWSIRPLIGNRKLFDMTAAFQERGDSGRNTLTR